MQWFALSLNVRMPGRPKATCLMDAMIALQHICLAAREAAGLLTVCFCHWQCYDAVGVWAVSLCWCDAHAARNAPLQISRDHTLLHSILTLVLLGPAAAADACAAATADADAADACC